MKLILAAAVCLSAPAADFTYTTKTEITGGSMKSMMGMASRMGGQQSGPTQTTHYYKGLKSAQETGRQTAVFDLTAETMTQINHDRKEYSTITFAEFGELMTKMTERMASMRGEKAGPDVAWKATVDITGNTKQVVGVQTREAVMKVQPEATANQETGTGMSSMTMDMWYGKMPGYETVKEFNRVMGTKMASAASGVNPMIAMQAGASAMKGIAEAGKKLHEIDGIALFTVTKMSGASMGFGGMRPPESGNTGNSPAVDPREASKDAGRDAVLSRLPGGLGGLGRKRPQQKSAPEQAPAPANPQPQAAAGDNLMMESTTEVVSFSSAPVADSAFQVPAGYKRVEHPMKQMGGR